MKLVYEISVDGRKGVRLPATDVPEATPLPGEFLRAGPAGLPELSELDVVRHYTQLSRRNVGVDTTFYPLGSCTMKYNPKALEEGARLFLPFHP
ncbi:MAG: aminomethyl-transferring glycine dehydrogenase subunit GcvPB, partial [Thermodesulfobacteriota bacterium]|nr:aminomethyl-transferring glycine dehydrogenase subunit GcvPB [Thermodesulfobacteriota bacterium]